jgi:hypothetical protein
MGAEVGDTHIVSLRAGGTRHEMTRERLGCLWRVWRSPDSLGFLSAATAVAVEAAASSRSHSSLSVVAQVCPELRAWVRDSFGIRGEAMTSALSFSDVFPEMPFVLSGACTDEWHVGVDDIMHPAWSSTPWPHSVLLVLDEWCSVERCLESGTR